MQLRLEDALIAIRASGDTDALRQGETQRGELIVLRATIATAGLAALFAMRADVMARIAAASSATSARNVTSGFAASRASSPSRSAASERRCR